MARYFTSAVYVNVWYRWCAGVNESRKLEELTPSEL